MANYHSDWIEFIPIKCITLAASLCTTAISAQDRHVSPNSLIEEINEKPAVISNPVADEIQTHQDQDEEKSELLCHSRRHLHMIPSAYKIPEKEIWLRDRHPSLSSDQFGYEDIIELKRGVYTNGEEYVQCELNLIVGYNNLISDIYRIKYVITYDDRRAKVEILGKDESVVGYIRSADR